MLNVKEKKILSSVNKTITYENGIAFSMVDDDNYNLIIKKQIEIVDELHLTVKSNKELVDAGIDPTYQEHLYRVNEPVVTIPYKTIQEASMFVNKKIPTISLKGIHFNILENSLVVVATDRTKLYKRTIKTKNNNVLANRTISILSIKLLKLINPKTVSIEITNDSIVLITNNGFTIIDKTYSDKYVDYNTVIPTTTTEMFLLDTKEIINIYDSVNKIESIHIYDKPLEMPFNCIALTETDKIISYKSLYSFVNVHSLSYVNTDIINKFDVPYTVNTDNVIVITRPVTGYLDESTTFAISKDSFDTIIKIDNSENIKLYDGGKTYLLQLNSIDSIR